MFDPIVVVDLDGTMFDCGHRQHLAQAGEWDEFHSKLVDDTVNDDVRTVVEELDGAGFMIVYCTGRNERWRTKTMETIKRLDCPFPDLLLMRPDHDFTPDHELKPKMLKEFLDSDGGSVVCILEDRDKVVEAWRNHGYNCWQVRPGGY